MAEYAQKRTAGRRSEIGDEERTLFGLWLRRTLREIKVAPKDLAADCGMTRAAIYLYIGGWTHPQPHTIRHLARYLADYGATIKPKDYDALAESEEAEMVSEANLNALVERSRRETPSRVKLSKKRASVVMLGEKTYLPEPVCTWLRNRADETGASVARTIANIIIPEYERQTGNTVEKLNNYTTSVPVNERKKNPRWN